MENACQCNNAKVQQCNNAKMQPTRNCSNKVPKMVQKEECSSNKYLKFGTED